MIYRSKILALSAFACLLVMGQDLTLLSGKRDGMFLERLEAGKVVRRTFVNHVSSYGEYGDVVLLAGTPDENNFGASVFDRNSGERLFEIPLRHQPLSWITGPKRQVVFQDEGQTAYFVSYEPEARPLVCYLEKVDLNRRDVESVPLPSYLNGSRLAAVPSGLAMVRNGMENIYLFDPGKRNFTVYEPDETAAKTLGNRRVAVLDNIGVFAIDTDLVKNDLLRDRFSYFRTKSGTIDEMEVHGFGEGDDRFFVLAANRNNPQVAHVYALSKVNGDVEPISDIPFQMGGTFALRQGEELIWWNAETRALEGFKIRDGAREVIATFDDETLKIYAVFE